MEPGRPMRVKSLLNELWPPARRTLTSLLAARYSPASGERRDADARARFPPIRRRRVYSWSAKTTKRRSSRHRTVGLVAVVAVVRGLRDVCRQPDGTKAELTWTRRGLVLHSFRVGASWSVCALQTSL